MDNDDKIYNPAASEPTAVAAPPVSPNPLLARVEMPGSTFQLPSRGIFYKNGELHPDVQMGEVHVNPMSAYDEILMKSPDQLFSGEAVEKVFNRCVRGVLKPKELLARDIDFLLVCLRQVTYGDDMEVMYTHDCKDAKSNSYILQLSKFITSTKKIDPTTAGKVYSVIMDNGQTVNLHPAKFKDVLKIYQDTEAEDGTRARTPEEDLELSVFVIKSIIESVDGVTNQEQIEEWIKQIPAGWLHTLTNAVEESSDFGPDFTLKTKCKDCGKDIEIVTPINPISFFM
jgi:hypothetical protein